MCLFFCIKALIDIFCHWWRTMIAAVVLLWLLIFVLSLHVVNNISRRLPTSVSCVTWIMALFHSAHCHGPDNGTTKWNAAMTKVRTYKTLEFTRWECPLRHKHRERSSVFLTSPLAPSSPPRQEESPSGRWGLTAGGKSPSCGTESRNRPSESPGCSRRAAGSPAARCRTSPSSPAATPWQLSTFNSYTDRLLLQYSVFIWIYLTYIMYISSDVSPFSTLSFVLFRRIQQSLPATLCQNISKISTKLQFVKFDKTFLVKRTFGNTVFVFRVRVRVVMITNDNWLKLSLFLTCFIFAHPVGTAPEKSGGNRCEAVE